MINFFYLVLISPTLKLYLLELMNLLYLGAFRRWYRDIDLSVAVIHCPRLGLLFDAAMSLQSFFYAKIRLKLLARLAKSPPLSRLGLCLSDSLKSSRLSDEKLQHFSDQEKFSIDDFWDWIQLEKMSDFLEGIRYSATHCHTRFSRKVRLCQRKQLYLNISHREYRMKFIARIYEPKSWSLPTESRTVRGPRKNNTVDRCGSQSRKVDLAFRASLVHCSSMTTLLPLSYFWSLFSRLWTN